MTQMVQIPPLFDPALRPRLSPIDAEVWDAIDAELAALVGRSPAELEREAHSTKRP